MMDRALRIFVRQRAGGRCEYCRLPQLASQFSAFHIEHIIAMQHGGATEAENLALSCGYCNFHKGPNIASLDPHSSELVPLFHPRRYSWEDHFEWQGVIIFGKSSVGRATVHVLAMNDWQRIELRENLQSLGEDYGH